MACCVAAMRVSMYMALSVEFSSMVLGGGAGAAVVLCAVGGAVL